LFALDFPAPFFALLTRGATYPGLPPEFAYPARVRRSDNRDHRFYINPARITRLSPCQAGRLGIQRFRNGRSARGNHDGDNLQRRRLNGTSVLDPCFWAPLLLVTHYVTFVLLRRPWQS